MNCKILPPKGAILNTETLERYTGGTLYRVTGLGPSSSVVRVRDVSKVIKGDLSLFVTCVVDGSMTVSSMFLSDWNIGANYNCHFIFADYEDALSYMMFAKHHTPSSYYEGRGLFADLGC